MSLCLSYRDAEAETFPERHKPRFMSTTSSNVSISTTWPPLASAPAAPPVSFAFFDPAHFREVSPQKPQLGSENQGESHLCIEIRNICLLVMLFCISRYDKSSTSSNFKSLFYMKHHSTYKSSDIDEIMRDYLVNTQYYVI